MAAQSSQGIQTLLEAEKEASKIVQKARQYRVQRLKDARTEATKEIEALKAQKQAEYAQYEKNYLGSSDDSLAKVNAETEAKLVEIKQQYETGKDKVLANLLQTVMRVQPQVHENTRTR